ncbi:hypothetical protein JJJ21_10535 [Klebsiella grimontii]|nr:hypothetical protein [Klebsiella grimontii]
MSLFGGAPAVSAQPFEQHQGCANGSTHQWESGGRVGEEMNDGHIGHHH